MKKCKVGQILAELNGYSDKIVWKLSNVWKRLESLDMVYYFDYFRNFAWKWFVNYI